MWLIDRAVERFRFRRLVTEGEHIGMVAGSEPILRYDANSFVHFEDGVLPRVEGPRPAL